MIRNVAPSDLADEGLRERTFHLLDEKMRALIASDMSAYGP
jgi:hypothetical protein